MKAKAKNNKFYAVFIFSEIWEWDTVLQFPSYDSVISIYLQNEGQKTSLQHEFHPINQTVIEAYIIHKNF